MENTGQEPERGVLGGLRVAVPVRADLGRDDHVPRARDHHRDLLLFSASVRGSDEPGPVPGEGRDEEQRQDQ